MFDKVSEFELVVEKRTLCHGYDKMAVLALTFTTYKFHVEYPDNQSSTMTVFKKRTANYKLNSKNLNVSHNWWFFMMQQ